MEKSCAYSALLGALLGALLVLTGPAELAAPDGAVDAGASFAPLAGFALSGFALSDGPDALDGFGAPAPE